MAIKLVLFQNSFNLQNNAVITLVVSCNCCGMNVFLAQIK